MKAVDDEGEAVQQRAEYGDEESLADALASGYHLELGHAVHVC